MDLLRNCRNATLALLSSLVALSAAPAHADFHTFVIDELYTTADGAVQYIVLREAQGANGQNVFAGHQIVSANATTVKTFPFPTNLPSATTASKRVLIGTTSYAALGLVAPDYTMPDRFLPTEGGTLNYGGVDIIGFPALPTDGTNAWFRSGSIGANVATNFAGATGSVPTAPVTVIEFYNMALDHYFISPLAPDIDALDSGRLAGWTRTGFTFKANPAAAAGVNPVCRFYIPPQKGDSHFFTASPAECADVAGKIMTDPNYAGFSFETPSAFYIALPDLVTGACPAGTQPVYRLWNNRADSNHRYTTSQGVRAQMLARGYIPEGYGPDSVIMCAPAIVLQDTTARLTAASPFAPGCDGVPPSGVLYAGSEVEPFIAANPRDPFNLVGVWQQDRWSNGGAAGLATGVSQDGGHTWARRSVPFTRCSGGNAANGGDYERASDPWVTIAPDGTAYQVALALNGGSFTPNSSNAVLVSRSTDGGFTWSNPLPLIQDGSAFFNDKESITADPTDARYVYAVWDRLAQNGNGPTWLARTVNGGQSWSPAAQIYNPGPNNQTINNQIVGLPDGTVLNFFTQLDTNGTNITATRLSLMRSADKGASWSAPIPIALVQTVGTKDPDTNARVRDGSTLGAIAAGKDGSLAVAWQDARFGSGTLDGIAFSRSLDGGLTWTAPVRINAAPTVAAFVPAVAIRDDGAIGVTYYDFRNNTPDPATLPTDYWLTQSADGVVWTEQHVAGPFDLLVAPVANGLFIGDYQGLATFGSTFYPFYALTNAGDTANRTDVLATTAYSVKRAPSGLDIPTTLYAQSAPPLPMTPELEARIADNIAQVIAARAPNWVRSPAPSPL